MKNTELAFSWVLKDHKRCIQQEMSGEKKGDCQPERKYVRMVLFHSTDWPPCPYDCSWLFLNLSALCRTARMTLIL